MITRCRDVPADVRWRLIKMGEGAPTGGGSRALLEWAKSEAAQAAVVSIVVAPRRPP